MTRTLIASLATLASFAPAAGAATVELEPGGAGEPHSLRVRADAAEANRMSIVFTRETGQTQTRATVHDDVAILVPGEGCSATDDHTVQCVAAALGDSIVDLGDLDDVATVDVANSYVVVEGGEGNDDLTTLAGGSLEGGLGDDRLTGSPVTDTLTGGAGDDRLEAGDGGDYLDGGAGDDEMRAGPGHDNLYAGPVVGSPDTAGNDQLYGEEGNDTLSDEDAVSRAPVRGPDLVSGGPGDDAVYSYALRQFPVHVDLNEVGGDGEAGEDDSLEGVEMIIGGEARDVLLGDGDTNVLDGRGGADVVRGRGGNDVIPAGPGDRVSGESGRDEIRPSWGYQRRPGCGPGRDVIRIDPFEPDPPKRGGRGPLLGGDCERLAIGSTFEVSARPVRITAGGRMTFRFFRFRCCSRRLGLTGPKRPFRPLDVTRIRSTRRTIDVPRRFARRGTTVRAVVERVAPTPVAWRFRAP